MTAWYTILLMAVNSFSLIVGSCANLLVVISFFVFVTAKETTELFLVSLSVADVLLCAVYQPLLVIRIGNAAQNRSFILAQSFFGFALMIASLNGLLAVTVDRFLSIYMPFKYFSWMTERNAVRVIAASWVTSLIMAMLNCAAHSVGIIVVQVYATIILFLVPVLYSVIYKEARKQAKRIVQQCPTATRKPARPTHKATRGVGLVMATTVACWMPVILFPVLLSSFDSQREHFFKEIMWCVTASCLNSCINPFIYYWQFTKMRRVISKSLGKIATTIGLTLTQNTRRQTAVVAFDPGNCERRITSQAY